MTDWTGAILLPTKEIYTRLSAASAANKKLAGSKVYVGSRHLVEEIEDTPSIVFWFESSRDLPGHAGAYNQQGSELVFSGVIKYGIADDSNENRLYGGSAGSETGFLPYLENFCDVLNETSASTPVFDPRLSANTSKQILIDLNNTRHFGNLILIDFSISVTSIDFAYNARRTAK